MCLWGSKVGVSPPVRCFKPLWQLSCVSTPLNVIIRSSHSNETTSGSCAERTQQVPGASPHRGWALNVGLSSSLHLNTDLCKALWEWRLSRFWCSHMYGRSSEGSGSVCMISTASSKTSNEWEQTGLQWRQLNCPQTSVDSSQQQTHFTHLSFKLPQMSKELFPSHNESKQSKMML